MPNDLVMGAGPMGNHFGISEYMAKSVIQAQAKKSNDRVRCTLKSVLVRYDSCPFFFSEPQNRRYKSRGKERSGASLLCVLVSSAQKGKRMATLEVMQPYLKNTDKQQKIFFSVG